MKSKFLVTILLLGLLTLYFSCQKEDDSIVQTEQSVQRTLTKKILSKKDIDSNIKITELLNRINNNANNQKSLAYDSSNDLYIDTEEVIYLEEGYNHSYTFYVYSLENNSVLKNIVLSINAEGSYDAYLWTYYNNGVDDIDSETQIDVVKLENFDSNGILSKNDPTTGCSNGELQYIEIDWEDGSGNIYDESSACPGDCTIVWYWLPCPNTGGGSTSDDSGSDGSSDNGSSNNDSGNYHSGIDDGGNNNGGSISGPSGGSTSGNDNDPNPVITTPKKKDGSSAAGSFLIDIIGEENLTPNQIDWINNINDSDSNQALYSIILSNNSSIESIIFVIESINRLREGIVSINEVSLTGTTLLTDVPWTPNAGQYNGIASLAYTHTRTIVSDGRLHTQFLLANGDVLSSSVYPNPNSPSQLVDVLFYFSQETQLWYDFQAPRSYEPLSLDFLWDGFWSTTLTAVRVFTPLEDIIILIDGKDLEGVEQSRAVAATFILVDIIPGSSAVKAIKMVKYGDEAIQLAEAVVKYVDDIYKSQKETIQNVLDGLIDLDQFDNTIRKGNFGEMVTDEDLYSRGYEPLHIRRTDIDQPLDTGIDGVFKNPETGEYIIVESKFNNAQLSTLEDGTRQMSDEWITNGLNDASDRLFIEIGSDPILYDDIMLNGYQRIKAKVLSDGTVTYRFIGSDGYVILGNAGIFTP